MSEEAKGPGLLLNPILLGIIAGKNLGGRRRRSRMKPNRKIRDNDGNAKIFGLVDGQAIMIGTGRRRKRMKKRARGDDQIARHTQIWKNFRKKRKKEAAAD